MFDLCGNILSKCRVEIDKHEPCLSYLTNHLKNKICGKSQWNNEIMIYLTTNSSDPIYIFSCDFTGWQINFGRCANEGNKTLKLATSIGSQPDAVFVPNVGDVAVYDLQNGELVYELNGHYNAVNCCVYHPIYQVSTFLHALFPNVQVDTRMISTIFHY